MFVMVLELKTKKSCWGILGSKYVCVKVRTRIGGTDDVCRPARDVLNKSNSRCLKFCMKAGDSGD